MEHNDEILKYHQKWGFGMAPLKSKTAYAYRKATNSVLKLLNGVPYTDIHLDDISLFKGLINRCIRQDQWDWFTVYANFGEPDPIQLRKIPSQLTKLRKSIQASDIVEIQRNINKLIEVGTIRLCEAYLGLNQATEKSNDTYGYVYILSKREEPNILKIGMTNRNVEKRVKEINAATGVLFPYSVRSVFKVLDAKLAEKTIFEVLDEYRIRKDREFFMIDYRKAVQLITDTLHQHSLLYKID